MQNNIITEDMLFDTNEILEVYLDLLNRQIGSAIKQRNFLDNINQELKQLLGISQKKYKGRLLYIISEIDHIKTTIMEYFSKCHHYMDKEISMLTGIELILELASNNRFLADLDVIIIEDIDTFCDSSKAIHAKLAGKLEDYLEQGGQVIVTGNIYDNTGDPLSEVLYEGNVLNLTYH